MKIEDILAVQTRLDDVRGQIEQLQAQHKEVTGLADLSTLNVTLIPSALQQAAGRWDPGKTIGDAFAALVDVGQNVGDGVIWFAIVWLPVLIGLGIVVLLVWRFVPGLRSRGGATKDRRHADRVARDAQRLRWRWRHLRRRLLRREALHLALYSIAGKGDPELFRAVLRIVPPAILAPSLLVVAGFLDGVPQIAGVGCGSRH